MTANASSAISVISAGTETSWVWCVGDVDACSSSSLATAAAAASSGQLFMMNLLVHSLMDDSVGLEVALESALEHQVQVVLLLLSHVMSQ